MFANEVGNHKIILIWAQTKRLATTADFADFVSLETYGFSDSKVRENDIEGHVGQWMRSLETHLKSERSYQIQVGAGLFGDMRLRMDL